MATETVLNNSDTHSNSLKTTVPKDIVSKYGLEKGSLIIWSEITLLEGSILNGNKKRILKEPESLIIIKITGKKKEVKA